MGIILKLFLVVSLVKGSLTSRTTFYKQYQDESFCELSKKLEAQCASYCFKVVKPLLHMSAECQKKDVQIAEFQKQLEEIKIKMVMSETSLMEKDNQCKLKVEHANEILNIKLKSTIDELKNNIQQKDEQIRSLQLKISEHNIPLKKDQPPERSNLASNCYDFGKFSGIKTIKVPNSEPFPVKCESNMFGIGWTIIQRRFDGKVNFNRNWNEYRLGFGDYSSEFFIGLEKLHKITFAEPHELYIFMKDRRSQVRNARYNKFKIDSEKNGYKLIELGNYTGYSGDNMRTSLNMKFSTFDKDNDECKDLNCAVICHGGWWFNCCGPSNLNGDYSGSNMLERLSWNSVDDQLSTVTMLIRPKRQNLK